MNTVEPFFNEQDYLGLYPDVARAIENGNLLSGKQHYVLFGKTEGRRPYRFDANWYTRSYPKCQRDIKNGTVASLKEHYEQIGYLRGWLPHAPATEISCDFDAKVAALENSTLIPVLVTFIPRSGSTLLMSMLAAQPRVVVAKHYPYEVRLATYFAHAHHVIAARGDHQSANPFEFMRNMRALPFNPFNHPDFNDVFSDPNIGRQFFDRYVPEMTKGFSRRLANDYYKLAAVDQNKASSQYFAEKCEANLQFRAIFKRSFPETREIVIVRDLRDVYCSYHRYFPDTPIRDAASIVLNSGRILNTIRDFDESDILFIRYEDCVRDPKLVVGSVCQFLNLEPELGTVDRSGLFNVHATSTTPEASIGRWQQDLTGEERTTFMELAGDSLYRYNSVFGYAS